MTKHKNSAIANVIIQRANDRRRYFLRTRAIHAAARGANAAFLSVKAVKLTVNVITTLFSLKTR